MKHRKHYLISRYKTRVLIRNLRQTAGTMIDAIKAGL